MTKILVLHGPNLNLLGQREPDIYGTTTLRQINTSLENHAREMGFSLTHMQTNAEHLLCGRIQDSLRENTDFILINPGALTHTSVVIRDALAAVQIPFIEVHMSNVYAREPFRKHSYLSDLAVGVISGFGAQSYLLALKAAAEWLKHRR